MKIKALLSVVLACVLNIGLLSSQHTQKSTVVSDECARLFYCHDSVIYRMNIQEEYKKLSSKTSFSVYMVRISRFLIQRGLYEEAVKLLSASLNEISYSLGANNVFYEYARALLLWASDEAESYDRADDDLYFEPCFLPKEKGRVYMDYLTSLKHQAHSLYMRGNFEEALGLQDTTIKSYEAMGNQKLVAYMYMEKALCYDHMRDMQKALETGMQGQKLAATLSTVSDPEFLFFLGNNACFSAKLGDLEKGKQLTLETVEIAKKHMDSFHQHYITGLTNLAAFYHVDEEYDQAVKLLNEAKVVCEKYKELDSHSSMKILYLLGINYAEMNDYQQALENLNLALAHMKKRSGIFNDDYAECLVGIADAYFKSGDKEKAIAVATEAMLIQKGMFGEGSNRCAEIFKNLSDYSTDGEQIALYYRDAFRINRDNLIKNFATMTLDEQKLYWQNSEQSVAAASSEVALKSGNGIGYATAYDASLLTKGLLLNSEIEIKDLIYNSGDGDSKRLLAELEEVNNRLKALDKRGRGGNIDSLRWVRDSIFKRIVRNNQMIHEYTNNLSVVWEDVQQELQADELAVEFVTVGDEYVALVLGTSMQGPQLVRLCTTAQLDALNMEEDCTSGKMYELVWKAVSPFFKGISDVYFSPVGRLYAMPIEVSGSSSCPKVRFHRVSSTRELVRHQVGEKLHKKLLLFGGLNYSMDMNALRARPLLADAKQRSVSRELLDSLRNMAFLYLPGTFKEIHSIRNLCRENAAYRTSVYVGNDGTEENFLSSVADSVPSVIHLATHGFYWTRSEADTLRKKYKLDFLNPGNATPLEDKALCRSGLLFSGANNVISGKKIPQGMQDGILTAEEIALLNLRGCELVVLSACQTGLGDISSEGVFGLQRGFKKAGVHAILMSLWKIDDRATSLFMREFYKHYLNGKTAQEALLLSQEFLQHTEKYAHPRYWAGFILLDSFNARDDDQNRLLKYERENVVKMEPFVLQDSIQCQGVNDYSYYSVDYPVGNDEVSVRIKDCINRIMMGDDYKKNRSLRKVLKGYADEYLKNSMEYLAASDSSTCKYIRDERGDLYKMETMRELFQDQHILTLESFHEVFDGGAHPNYGSKCFTIYKHSGRQLGWDSFKEGSSEKLKELVLNALAIQYFKKTYKEALREDFMLAGDTILLPRSNPYITKEGVVFSYQPYEIACFAQGMPRCILPLGLLTPFLKKEFIDELLSSY